MVIQREGQLKYRYKDRNREDDYQNGLLNSQVPEFEPKDRSVRQGSNQVPGDRLGTPDRNDKEN